MKIEQCLQGMGDDTISPPNIHTLAGYYAGFFCGGGKL